MPGVEFSFQDTGAGDSSGNRAWIVIAILVSAVTIGVILLVRAFGERDGAADGANRPAGEETAAQPARAEGGAKGRTATPPPAPQFDLKEASESALAFMRAGEAAEKADNRILVPVGALFNENGQSFVFLYEKDTEEARKMPVMVGALRADGMAEVRGALRPGDPVVASGVGKLKDGQKIKPLAAASNLNYGNLL